MTVKTIKKDPPVRKDGRCSQCGGEKPVPSPAQKNLVDLYTHEINADPFCSTKCCREYFGTEWDLPRDSRNMSRRYTE